MIIAAALRPQLREPQAFRFAFFPPSFSLPITARVLTGGVIAGLRERASPRPMRIGKYRRHFRLG
ncbi:hypothetical protein CBM2634_B170128 [Cupriavidus taiwanensis]|uniref:Uncharacterized protein n=1 Tax=Cupriavidus taiwanensis TaxID=164546 RepID=A0A375J896_9BURK|nr:hypothetical protein CBM2634_B170128 [Cupriavidus taiwanensis]